MSFDNINVIYGKRRIEPRIIMKDEMEKLIDGVTKNDEFGKKVEWTALYPRSNYTTTGRFLKRIDEYNLVITESGDSGFIASLGFLIAGIFIAGAGYTHFGPIYSVGIIVVSILLLIATRKSTNPYLMSFNKDMEKFYVGNYTYTPVEIDLKDIHAIQVIRKISQGEKSEFYTYETNIITKSGKRENLMDHGKLEKQIEDATNICEFLNVPLWDASNI